LALESLNVCEPIVPSLLSDLISLYEADSLGTFGTNIFASTNATIPRVESGAILTLVETGGTSPENTHNSVLRPAYIQPGAQVIARSVDYQTAFDKAKAAYDSSFITNQMIGSTWYQKIRPTTEPADLKPDKRGNARVGFNLIAKRRP